MIEYHNWLVTHFVVLGAFLQSLVGASGKQPTIYPSIISTPWEIIGNLANILQIVTAIPVFLAAAYYILHRRRIKRALADLNQREGEKTAVLAIDCMGGSILVQAQEHLRRLNISMPSAIIEEYQRQSVSPESVHVYLRELRELRDRMIAEGVTELHLFIRGPVALAMGIGAIYDSNFPVHVYQFAQAPDPKSQQTYQYWITLHQGAVAGMPPSRVERTLEMAGQIT